MGDLSPVSYTHLDVYKRQGLREELLNNRSDAYYRLNDFKNSIKDAQDACAGNIKNATGTQDYPSERAYRSLVLSYLDSHQPAEALKVLDLSLIHI